MAHGVEISAGIHTSFGSDHRQQYGNASAFSFAYSAPLSPKDVHLIIEVGYSSNSGSASYNYLFAASADPPQPHYWFVPITIGVRTNLIPERYQGPLGLYYGIGLLTVFTGYELGSFNDTSPSLGGMMELRPQLQLTPGVAIWVRERMSIIADAQYDSGDINYSGASLQGGLSFFQP